LFVTFLAGKELGMSHLFNRNVLGFACTVAALEYAQLELSSASFLLPIPDLVATLFSAKAFFFSSYISKKHQH
jgi:hypothetical protein